MIVADTDVLIDFLRDYSPVAERVALELDHGLATTTVTAFELWDGSTGSSRREHAVETLLAALKILSLDTPSARTAARIRSALRSSGRAMAMADALIAGICIEHDATLLTRNRRHFEGIEQLALGRLGDETRP